MPNSKKKKKKNINQLTDSLDFFHEGQTIGFHPLGLNQVIKFSIIIKYIVYQARNQIRENKIVCLSTINLFELGKLFSILPFSIEFEPVDAFCVFHCFRSTEVENKGENNNFWFTSTIIVQKRIIATAETL